MKYSIAVINQKGGVGKTACSYNLAYSLSEYHKIILIDLDPSANATKGFNITNFFFDSSNIFIKNQDIEELFLGLINYNHNDYLKILPSHIKLALVQRELQSRPFKETILYKFIEKIHYFTPSSVIITDCSPTLSDLTINALYASNVILIPVSYDDDALEGLGDLFDVIKEIKEKQQYIFKIIRNKKDARKTKTNAYIEDKLKSFIDLGHVFNTIIRQDEAINQAKIERKPIFQYSPNSSGSRDFYLLTQEILKCLIN